MSREQEWSDDEIQDELDDLNKTIRVLRTENAKQGEEIARLRGQVQAGRDLADASALFLYEFCNGKTCAPGALDKAVNAFRASLLEKP